MLSGKSIEKQFYDLLKKRDKKAIEILYDHYSPVMFGIIMHIVRNETVAENILTKTFKYIWSNYKEFDPIRQNVCLWIINTTRKMCNKEVSFQKFTLNNNEPALFSAIDKSKLSFSGIPPAVKNKKVLDLLFFGNGSITEVAKHTGMSESEIKYSLHEAVSGLKRMSEKV